MGLYFRKRVKILPGVHLNISNTGTSWSVGPRGASVNVGKRGVYVNTGIPRTGIYSRTKISGGSSNYEINIILLSVNKKMKQLIAIR